MINQLYSSIYLGDSSVQRIYQGDDLIYSSERPDILLEYISNGDASTQPNVYFNSSVSPSLTTKVEIRYSIHSKMDSTVLFGSGKADNSTTRYWLYLHAGINIDGTIYQTNKFWYRNTEWGYPGSIRIDEPHVISTFGNASSTSSATQVSIAVDGSIYDKTISLSAGIANPQPMYIFARNNHTEADMFCPADTKIYYMKIWEANNLIRFYIPVLHWNNGQYVPCLYDKVNDTYIYNLGTDTPTYKIQGDYLLDYIQNGPDSFSAVGVSYDTGLDSSVNLYYDVILRTPDASIWSGYRTLMGTGTVSGTDTGKAYSHQALYTYNSNYAIYNGVDTIGGNNINVNGNATFPIGDKVRISLNSLNNKLYAWFSNDSSTENLGGGYQDVPAAVPNGDFLLFGERQIDNTTTSYSYGGLRFYMLNFRYVNNTPAKSFVPVLHNNQAAFLDLNSGTYIYNLGTSAPYYQFKN